MAKNIILKIIKLYQLILSPALGKNCRFYPSCSEYSYLAVQKHGALKGFLMGAKRIIKCNPWNKGGINLP